MQDNQIKQEVSLNERILQLLNEHIECYSPHVQTNVNFASELSAANAIEKLILNEQLELLKNFYYGEDLKDHENILDHYKRVLETAKEHYTNQLKELQ